MSARETKLKWTVREKHSGKDTANASATGVLFFFCSVKSFRRMMVQKMRSEAVRIEPPLEDAWHVQKFHSITIPVICEVKKIRKKSTISIRCQDHLF